MIDPFKDHFRSLRTMTDKSSHDLLINQRTECDISTILHVYKSSVPRCRSFLSKLELWAKSNSSYNGDQAQHAKMDYTPGRSFVFLFAPNQLPITVLMVGQRWARTVAGTEVGEIERLVRKMMEEYHRLADG